LPLRVFVPPLSGAFFTFLLKFSKVFADNYIEALYLLPIAPESFCASTLRGFVFQGPKGVFKGLSQGFWVKALLLDRFTI
jgi:hypothetical protein